jgi:predicted glycosyltransferase/CheY-like chemotaxis protein
MSDTPNRPDPGSAPSPAKDPSKILIVEDEMIVQLHLENIVSGLGHEVTGMAANTAEALEAAAGNSPDLVLMDIHLDDGNDGVETARLLREKHDCAVVFVTAYADNETVDRTSDVIPAGYVVKPFTGIEVRAAIQVALRGHGHLRRTQERARAQHQEEQDRKEMEGVDTRPSLRRPFGQDTKMMVYSHDTFGLGHLRRSLALIRQLSDDHPGLSTLLVSGSPLVHRYELPPRTDYVKLPAVRKVAPENYEARSLSMTNDGIHSMRSNLLLRTVMDYDPDVILVDHSPLGMRGELQPALEWLGKRGRCTRILGLRDIIDDPAKVREHWEASGMVDKLERHYDNLVVYGQQHVYDTLREYDLPESLAAKSEYVGYVCTRTDEPPEPATAGELPRVVVAIGGGDGGAETVIRPFLEMLAEHPEQIGFQTEVLTGPFLAPGSEKSLRARAENLPVNLQKFVPAPARLFSRAELVISTSGYNSTTEILRYGKRAILIPRVMHRKEQLIRATRMDELGLVRCMHPDDVTPEGLLREIRAALESDHKPLEDARQRGLISLDGAEGLSRFCGRLTVGVTEQTPS